DWYAIEPTETSFGWIHKNFLKRIETQPAKPAEQNNENASKNMVTVEGLLKTKTMTKIATHKLICPRNEIYLIKGEKDQLNPFNNRMVTIVGKLSSPVNDTLPIIEVDEIRASE
ncbi:MAG: hypothetical protein KBA46_07870, partial [Candidatus Omnitrophica bacterium]|nr:hypothetical protein [Candidatus Omnitrophota bacterium]